MRLSAARFEAGHLAGAEGKIGMIAKPWTPELIRDAAYFRRMGWPLASIALWTGIEVKRVEAMFPQPK